MTKHKEIQTEKCADCIHEHACTAWNIGCIHNMDATHCNNYETVKDSNAYFIGKIDGRKELGIGICRDCKYLFKDKFCDDCGDYDEDCGVCHRWGSCNYDDGFCNHWKSKEQV